MFKNYLKIAWRNLVKNKIITLLNLAGLTVAFTVAILLSMTALYDLSYNNFHKNLSSLYQVYTLKQTSDGVDMATSNPMPLEEALKAEIPGIENISRCLYYPALTEQGDNDLRLSVNWVDPDFVKLFTFPALSGNPYEGLKDKNSLVITEEAAQKVFGKIEVVGKTLSLRQNGELQSFKIAAVLENIPNNSSFDFEILANIKSFSEYKRFAQDWSSRNHDVFIRLKEGLSSSQFEKSTDKFVSLHYKDDIETVKRDGALPNDEGNYFELKLLPYKDMRFTSFSGNKIKTSRTYANLLLAISLLILLIACVNFVNMGIAANGKRLKEIGMRKTLGAQKRQLFFQFWSESLIIVILALVLGSLLSFLLLGNFQELFKTNASLTQFKSLTIISSTLLLVLAISLFSGGYPALLMSKLGTIQALKGKLSVRRGNILRNSLIIIQFGIAILLIVGTIVLYSQLQYMRNKDLGYNKKQVVSFLMNGKKKPEQVLKLLRDKFMGNPNILDVTASDINLGRGRDGSVYKSALGFEYQGREVKTNMLIVDYDFTETLEIPLVKGRSFNRNYPSDSIAVMVNETMARYLNEDDILSTSILIDSLKHPIIGVIKDYNFEKLDQAVAPITLFFTTNNLKTQYAFVKVAPQNLINTYENIKEVWKSIEPNAPFLGSFLDENIDRTLKEERSIITMVSLGALAAIILSCVGLFAMTLLIVSERTKEIGIRKVLGASISIIALMLTKDFLKLVGFSFLIAVPVSWWLLHNWLQQYAYKIELNVWHFILSGMIAVFIALITIGGKSIRAALQNPINSLRKE